jgi:V8-like Glu-specific endopeptidase
MSKSQSKKSFRPEVLQLEDRVLCAAQLVPNTAIFPSRAVVRVSTWFDFDHDGKVDPGELFAATGTVIGPHSALTSAHVVYDMRHGMFATAVVITPGQSGSLEPFGTYRAVNWVIPSVFSQVRGRAIDVAVLNISPGPLFAGSSDVGNVTGWLGLQPYPDKNLKRALVFNVGYPGETLSGYQQYSSSGKLRWVAGQGLVGWEEFRTSDLLVQHGSSGSPIFRYCSSTGQRLIVGVVSGGNSFRTIGYATRITPAIVSFILAAENFTGSGGLSVPFGFNIPLRFLYPY